MLLLEVDVVVVANGVAVNVDDVVVAVGVTLVVVVDVAFECTYFLSK